MQKGNSLILHYESVLSSRFCFLCKTIGIRALMSNIFVNMKDVPEWGIHNLMNNIVENVSTKYIEDTTMPCSTGMVDYTLTFWNSCKRISRKNKLQRKLYHFI